MNEQAYKRNLKSTLIEPFKQIKFGLYIFGISIAFVSVCAYLFVNAFHEQYEHVMGLFNVVDPNLRWDLVLNDVFKTNAIRVGILLTGYIAVLFGIIFRLTHRYYGPLISINRFVEQIGAGDYTKRVKIRERDELHDLVEQLNAMADTLEKRHGSQNQGVDKVS